MPLQTKRKLAGTRLVVDRVATDIDWRSTIGGKYKKMAYSSGSSRYTERASFEITCSKESIVRIERTDGTVQHSVNNLPNAIAIARYAFPWGGRVLSSPPPRPRSPSPPLLPPIDISRVVVASRSILFLLNCRISGYLQRNPPTKQRRRCGDLDSSSGGGSGMHHFFFLS